MVKKVAPKKKVAETEEVVAPEAVKGVKVSDEFPKREPLIPATVSEDPSFTIRLDNKRMEGRNVEQVMALVHGSAGAVKRVVIELETE